MDTELLIIDDESEIIIEVDTDVEVLEAAAQGPRGPQGPPGPIGNADGALLVVNRLSELATDPAAQADAQANIGLGVVDPLAYYILAKS